MLCYNFISNVLKVILELENIAEYVKKNAPKFNDKIPDIDNLAKFVLDAMNGVFYKDDKQICQLHCSKNYTEGCNDESYQIITIQPLFNCKTIKCDKLQSKTKTRKNSFP